MKVALPPLEVEPFRVDDPVNDEPTDDAVRDDPVRDDAEALIREAKRRARRRRLLYGGAAVAVAIAAVAALTTVQSDTPPPQNTAPAVAPRPAVPLGAPLVVGPDSASTLLTSWGQIHLGFIFVYADGRVLFASDALAALADFSLFSGVAERHLSALGLDLVRAGTLDPREVVEGLGSGWLPGAVPVGRSSSSPYWRDELWAEPTAHIWEPTAWALCADSGVPGEGRLGATDVVDKLPADVQPLLDGRQRLYDPIIGTGHWLPIESGPATNLSNYIGWDLSGWDCFEVTAAEASTLPNALGDGRFYYEGGSLNHEVIFPHGQPVVWGG